MTGFLYTNNKYYSQSTRWFQTDAGQIDYMEWLNLSSETGSSNTQHGFSDPVRDLATYQASLGKEATFDAFIRAVVQQGKHHWDPAYTADAVNNHIRSGF